MCHHSTTSIIIIITVMITHSIVSPTHHPRGIHWQLTFFHPPHHYREIKVLVSALGLPKDGFHTKKTAVDSEYALAVTLNFLAFPKREHSDMAVMWQIDRRALSE